MMNRRRDILKGTLSTAVITLAVSSGLLYPKRILAAAFHPSWNEKAFAANNLPGAIKLAFGSDLTEVSDQIDIKAPDIAENGAVVPVTVSSSLKNIRSIALFIEKNATPLAAQFDINNDTQAYVSTRIKMGKTSHIIAVVTAGEKNFSARKEVKVTIGGCGG